MISGHPGTSTTTTTTDPTEESATMNRLARLLTAVIAVGAAVGLGTVPAASAAGAAPHHMVRPADTGWDLH